MPVFVGENPYRVVPCQQHRHRLVGFAGAVLFRPICDVRRGVQPRAVGVVECFAVGDDAPHIAVVGQPRRCLFLAPCGAVFRGQIRYAESVVFDEYEFIAHLQHLLFAVVSRVYLRRQLLPFEQVGVYLMHRSAYLVYFHRLAVRRCNRQIDRLFGEIDRVFSRDDEGRVRRFQDGGAGCGGKGKFGHYRVEWGAKLNRILIVYQSRVDAFLNLEGGFCQSGETVVGGKIEGR